MPKVLIKLAFRNHISQQYILFIVGYLIFFLLQECCKWSAQNPGKIPDPWYKLKFRPKEKPVKIKKEKKEKELTKKQKEKLEKLEKVKNIHVSIFFSTQQFCKANHW